MTMAKANRQVQHRPERESARGKELAAARKEIRQLKRLVSRLQKTIRKLEDERGIEVTLEESSPEPTIADTETKTLPVEVAAEDPKCGKCGSTDLTKFVTPGGKTLIACRSCKTRR
jgi:hypothetical protein